MSNGNRTDTAVNGNEQKSKLPPDWALIDTWRSIREALAIAAGDDPERARAAHIRYCTHLARGREREPNP